MNSSHILGRDSETDALRWYLMNRPVRLLARNYRCKGGELDLIFEEQRPDQSPELVFVEVRARVSEKSWTDGFESVDWKKQKRLQRTAEHFLMKYRGRAQTMRFDILFWDGKEWHPMHNGLVI